MKLYKLVSVALFFILPLQETLAQSLASREVPARVIPVPDTVSPEIKKQIAAPFTPTWNVIPTTADGWREQVAAGAQAA